MTVIMISVTHHIADWTYKPRKLILDGNQKMKNEKNEKEKEKKKKEKFKNQQKATCSLLQFRKKKQIKKKQYHQWLL